MTRSRPARRVPPRPRAALLLLALPLALLLTACPPLPPPEKIAFADDPRVLRGAYEGRLGLYAWLPDDQGDGGPREAPSVPARLEAEPRYVSPEWYEVSGTFAYGAEPEVGFVGVVHGNDTQEYVRPAVSPPRVAEFVLELDGGVWELHGSEPETYDDRSDPTSWSGRVVDVSSPSGPSVVGWFQLWRAGAAP